ncbi:MAG: hypothetical protein U0795_19855 [Pirellulales bacterium]
MNAEDHNWVEKVHPLTRDAEADDPLELVAQPVIGDPAVMLECMVQEFIWMGWSRAELRNLFSHPAYPVLNELQRFFGPEETTRRIDLLFARTGQLQFRETVIEPDEEEVLELVQIEPLSARNNSRQGDDHGASL